MWFLIIIAVVLFGILLSAWLRGAGEKETALRPSENERLFRDGIGALVDYHIETLARRRIQLIKIDHYGVTNTSEWDAEIEHFSDKVLFPNMVAKDKVLIPVLFPELSAKDEVISPDLIATNQKLTHVKKMILPLLREIVEEKAKLRAAIIESELSFEQDMTPQDFERWCTKNISSSGWKATTTKATGDQGADVIAEKEGTRLVLQCKLYSTPVGNKAVQEAFAAQHHYRAKASAVVTNSTFTASAIALAATTGVLLLHYSDLNRLNSLITTTKIQAS
jgi:restriction system protein